MASARVRILAVVVLLVVASSAAALFLSARTPAAPDAGAVPTPEERVATLDNSLRAIEDGLRDAPRDRWDPQYVVEVLGREPQQLATWVRENTDWVPYRGILRGPTGVLMDRSGNSLDRALLLATMLQHAGHTVRLARGELTRARALELLPDLVARHAAQARHAFDTTSDADVSAAAEQYELDAAVIERTQESLSDGVGRLFSELHTRTAVQTERLLDDIKLPDADADWGNRYARALDMLRDHWWVQWSEGSAWHNLDLLAPDTAALVTANSALAIAELPQELYHRLAVRVVAEEWTAGTLSERRVLEHTLRPFETVGDPLVLQMWPAAMPQELGSDPDSRYGLRAVALEQKSWTVALAAGSRVVATGAISATQEEPARGGPLGGLGSAMLGAARSMRGDSAATNGGELSAVWLEYEIQTPAEAPQTIRRAVFDLFGPAARSVNATVTLGMDEQKRLTRSLALMLRTEIMPVTAAIAPEFISYLAGQRLLASRTALRAFAAGPSHLASIEPESLLAESGAPITPLYSLALARLDWSRHGDVQYVDRIGLLTRHRHPGTVGHAITLRGAVDIVTGEFGVSLAAPDAFVVRHAQGVFDTNAEALWWTGAGINNTGEAFATSRDWITLTSPDADLERLSLPDDARARIRQDLATGFTVVAPRQPVPRGPDQFVGWWRIDPVSGATEGVAGNGWGQCGAEYTATVEGVVVRAMWRGMWEYVLCQGINQVFNDFRRTGAELQARGIWFQWVGPIQSASPEDVFWSSHKGCLIGAMQAGLVSTLPFLIARYNVATQPWLMPRATWLDRLMRDQRGAIRLPPRLVRGQLPGLTRAQARGGPIVPAAAGRAGAEGADPIDPLGRTQPAGRNPGRAPELGKTRDLGRTQPDVKTQPGMAAPGGASPAAMSTRPQTYPGSLAEAERNHQAALQNASRATSGSMQSTRELVQYRAAVRDGLTQLDADHLDRLTAQANDAAARGDLAVAQARQAEAMVEWAKKAVNRGEIPMRDPSSPAPAGASCPPSCGTSSAGRAPGGALQAGNAGAASSFYPFSWGTSR